MACDVAQRADVAGLLGWIGARRPGLSAVMHAAGAAESVPLGPATVAGLEAGAAPKAAGAAHLDELTAGMGLDGFVVFSSIAATWGSGLQPGYAAANAFLDALVLQPRARRPAGTVGAWGPWGGGGMTDPESGLQLARRGLRLMDPALAVTALAQALDGGDATVTVADVDWDRFAASFTVWRGSPPVSGL